MAEPQSSVDVSTKLERIAKLAREAPEMAFRSLAHLIDIDWPREAYRRTRKEGARGVDGQSAQEYQANLEENLRSLIERAKSGTYRAPPVRRVHIPKAPWNQIRNTPRVYTPDDKAVQTPNSDTPYSHAGLDLRTEPIVLTAPTIEGSRYFSIQLIDAYTHNFDYIGSRATGNDGGSFLVVGPSWEGEVPATVKKVIRSETELVLAWYRTQLFEPDDIESVKQVQAGYKVQTLSAFLDQQAPQAAPPIDFIRPLTSEEQKTSSEFFNVLNFALRFCPTHPSEVELMARFARLGVGAGMTFDASTLSPELQTAIAQGMADAWDVCAEVQRRVDAKEVTSGDCFGTRAYLKNNYPFRMTGAVLGIYGNSKEEAIYPMYTVDSTGLAPDAATKRYTIRFAVEQLPPVGAFWSLTMYELPSSLLSANSIDRYLINSPMLPGLALDADGGLTLFIQHDSPAADKTANWLPAPNGRFFMAMRLYWPDAEALDGTWAPPPLMSRATLETPP
jgi:hypothetical protein